MSDIQSQDQNQDQNITTEAEELQLADSPDGSEETEDGELEDESGEDEEDGA
jgi:hypothetical protein